MRKKKDTHSFDFRPLGLTIRESRAFAPAFKIACMSFLFMPIIKNPFDFTNIANSHDILVKKLHQHWKSDISNA